MKFYCLNCQAPIEVDPMLYKFATRHGVLCDACMERHHAGLAPEPKPEPQPCRLPYADQ